jgi:hypothetical protein
MGQDEIVIDLEEDELLAQAVPALTRCGAASSDCCHPLAQTQIEPCDKRGVDLPAADNQKGAIQIPG